MQQQHLAAKKINFFEFLSSLVYCMKRCGNKNFKNIFILNKSSAQLISGGKFLMDTFGSQL